MAPTLLQPGSLQGHPSVVPIDHITDWLRKRMAEFSDLEPKSLKDRVLIAQSETGSGKSTVLPAHVFRLFRSERASLHEKYKGRSVLCTQPRVLTAKTLARDMAASPHYPDLALPSQKYPGTTGYQTGPATNKPPQGLIYATAGVLLVQLKSAASKGDYTELMSKYGVIIVDEAHERSLDTDLVLAMLKQFLLAGLEVGGEYARRLPFVILASATIDVRTYGAYFGLAADSGVVENVFHVVGRQHGIEERWPKVGTNDYIAEAVKQATLCHNQGREDPDNERDILVFLPGAMETQKVVMALEEARSRGALDEGGPVVILAINREAVNEETSAFVLVKAPLAVLWKSMATQEIYPAAALESMQAAGLHPRRIIVSTVVAETGLTVETLKYVIDAGWQRASESYHPYNVNGLITRPAAQSRIKQRKGRVGRLFPGIFLPLYTENVYESLPPQQLPDIVTEGASLVILDIILGQQIAKRLSWTEASSRSKAKSASQALGFRVEDMDLLDPPPVDAFASSIELVNLLGFFNGEAELLGRPPPPSAEELSAEIVGRGYGLTRMGRAAVLFPRLPLPYRRLLMAGPLWNCAATDLASIVAVCQVCASRGGVSLLDKKARRKVNDSADPAAALSKVLARAITEGLPPETKQEWFQDDVLDLLCVFVGYQNQVEKVLRGPTPLQSLETYCESLRLDPEVMLDMCSFRESAMEEMILAGLNPFWGERYRLFVTKNPKAQIQALKRCLYDAFRGNQLEPQVSPRSRRVIYHNNHGLPVRCSAATAATAPRVVVTPMVTIVQAQPKRTEMAQKHPPLKWELQAPLVSVLDTGDPLTSVSQAPDLDSPAE